MSQMPETFQIPLEAAEAYEARFVPALFAEWAPHLIDDSGLRGGQSVLDVACGTGIVARTVADRHPDARVVGVDLNEAMLTVARRVRPELDWRQADVAALPFPDGSFDVVLCQFALMFFPDRAGAVAQLARVVAPGGTVALSVPAGLDAQRDGYALLLEVAARHAGPEANALLGTYWSCGDLDLLRGLFAESGLRVTSARTFTSTAHYPSLDAFIATEVESTPLGGRVTQDVVAAIRADAARLLSHHTTPQGGLDMPLAGHVVVGRRG